MVVSALVKVVTVGSGLRSSARSAARPARRRADLSALCCRAGGGRRGLPSAVSSLRPRVLLHLQPATTHAQRALADGPRPLVPLPALRQEMQDQALPHQPPAAGARDPAAAGVLRGVLADGARAASVQCPLCPLRARSLAAARGHLAAHYPRDSPRCPVTACSRLFAHPNSVRNHMRVKHPHQWDRMKTLKWSCGWTDLSGE